MIMFMKNESTKVKCKKHYLRREHKVNEVSLYGEALRDM